MQYIELKLSGNIKIAKAEYRDNNFVETFSYFKMRIKKELEIEDEKDWTRVVWRKREEIEWTRFPVLNINNFNLSYIERERERERESKMLLLW